jgi:hypothetical protein
MLPAPWQVILSLGRLLSPPIRSRELKATRVPKRWIALAPAREAVFTAIAAHKRPLASRAERSVGRGTHQATQLAGDIRP